MVTTNFPMPWNSASRTQEFEDCVACRLTSAALFTGLGSYLLLRKRFHDPTSDFYKNVKPENVKFVSRSVKAGGILCIALGVLRAGDGILWRKEKPSLESK
ncbi:hypothetical protein POJ06DRAFT_270781 [Lipomyces tetrasporus]|uniref:DUF4536 domain-containing protein n=1 Tax=Lipomyces tetrasporus TaxID=54092 RepID=A0AAD7QQE3_9ASCO|nr:uncharacterized protein POJ06DRAFT_270781 [Lipomyces tetrasporus]KAJ8097967.1 hypothetical protein POJ06DRAFT_270781 [Lipomyces tetrasporus]